MSDARPPSPPVPPFGGAELATVPLALASGDVPLATPAPPAPGARRWQTIREWWAWIHPEKGMTP